MRLQTVHVLILKGAEGLEAKMLHLGTKLPIGLLIHEQNLLCIPTRIQVYWETGEGSYCCYHTNDSD